MPQNGSQLMDAHLDDFLRLLAPGSGAVLSLVEDRPPVILTGSGQRPLLPENLDRASIRRLLFDVLTDEQLAECRSTSLYTTTYSLPRVGRFELCLSQSRGGVRLTARLL